MKIPVIPLVVASTLVGGALFLFNSVSSDRRTPGVPTLARVADVDGIETELALAPDGTRLVAVASGDLWLFDLSSGSRRRLTQTTEKESFPSWAPDGNRITFTRGGDTFATLADSPSSGELLREDATFLSWSATGRQAFVRDRGLWVTDAAGRHERLLIVPDPDPDVTVQAPRFSPDALQIAFIRNAASLSGEIWLADADSGRMEALVTGRRAENPLDLGWLNRDQLVYLTNRSGANALWIVDLARNTLLPLTEPLNGLFLDRVGIAVSTDRILLPRHSIDSDIELSDGTIVAQASELEFEPSASPDGRRVAYTVQRGNAFEIWTKEIPEGEPAFRTLGTQPRFSPNGFEIAYTHTDIEGRVDVRKLDIRDSSSTPVTDAPESDFQPDWSPDGRTIVFASNVGGPMAVWTTRAVGGRRLRLNDGGYFPRFSPDGDSLVFWNRQALRVMHADGSESRTVRENVPEPVPAAWVDGSVRTSQDPEVSGGRVLWPQFDILPDGRILFAPIEIQDTAIWSVNLTYVRE